MIKDRTINYIEFAVIDIARAKDFYGKVSGWSSSDFGPDHCEFSDGQMKGGFIATGSEPPSPHGGALVVLYRHDLAALQTSIEAAGGEIVKPVFDFPGGQRFHFTDPKGYELAVWCET